jgi:hypothetical protein
MSPEQEDFMNKRFESFIQTMNGLFEDFTEKHVQVVDAKMDKKFNGKMEDMLRRHDEFRKENQDMYVALKQIIDSVDMKVNKISTDTAPLVEGKNTFSSIFKFVLWSSPLAIIYGAFKWLKL